MGLHLNGNLLSVPLSSVLNLKSIIMEYIAHRINTINELMNISPEHGVEIDLRVLETGLFYNTILLKMVKILNSF